MRKPGFIADKKNYLDYLRWRIVAGDDHDRIDSKDYRAGENYRKLLEKAERNRPKRHTNTRGQNHIERIVR